MSPFSLLPEPATERLVFWGKVLRLGPQLSHTQNLVLEWYTQNHVKN